MISEAVLDAMLAAGCTAEQIVAAVKADASEADARRSRGRAGNAKRQKAFRDRNKSNAVTRVTAVTSRDEPPSPSSPHTPQQPLTPNSEANASESAAPSVGFEDFWQAFPRREGDNPRKPAELAWSRAIKRGATPNGLLDAAEAYRRQNPAPTRFIPRASTWLNEDRWRVEPTSSEVPRAGVVPSMFVREEDDRTPELEAIYVAKHGKKPPSTSLKGVSGIGWFYPSEWVERVTTSKAVAAA